MFPRLDVPAKIENLWFLAVVFCRQSIFGNQGMWISPATRRQSGIQTQRSAHHGNQMGKSWPIPSPKVASRSVARHLHARSIRVPDRAAAECLTE